MLSLVNSVIMTLFASVIFISFYQVNKYIIVFNSTFIYFVLQIIIVYGQDYFYNSMDESLRADDSPDAGSDIVDDIPG